MSGWSLTGDPIVVPGARLDEYLDTDALHFRRYGAVDLTVGKYTAADQRGFATVEIFRFPDFVKAFGAYSMRKQLPAAFLPIENEAFVGKHSIHLWRGPFYVRITGASPSDRDQSLRRLLAAVAERMPAAPAKPAVFNFFPAVNRLPNSERFSAEGALGQQFLANAFQMTFVVDGETIEGLAIPAANKAVAIKILDAYRSLYLANGKLLDPIPNLGEDNFTAEDKYLGRVVAFRIDRFLIAFNSYGNRQKLVDLAVATDQRILASFRKQLVGSEEQ